jgi:hypothetical protein
VDVDSPVFIMSKQIALNLSLMLNALGQREFPDINMDGGTLFGVPVVTSQYLATGGSPAGAYVILINASDIYLHDSYYVIGHFHYVVAPGTIFALFAGIYFWYPKITGRYMSEILGKIHFFGSFLCMNLIFFPMFIQGMRGMSRRMYDGGATYFLPRVVGERKALEIALLGERFTAQEAKDNNILNWVVPKDSLVAETEKMARKLADGPTFALGVAKKLIRNSFDNSWDEHSHREAEGLAACAATEDHFEGLSAFLEKRKAKFKGR